MDDLISRKVAIDDIETVNPSMPLSVNWVKNWVKALPPAQPERSFLSGLTPEAQYDKLKWLFTDYGMQYTDSRQAIIQWLASQPQPEPTLEQIEEYCHKRCLSIVDNALLHKYAQVEIQPEIIRCKDCKHYRECEIFGRKITLCKRREYDALSVEPDDFCSYAERKKENDVV